MKAFLFLLALALPSAICSGRASGDCYSFGFPDTHIKYGMNTIAETGIYGYDDSFMDLMPGKSAFVSVDFMAFNVPLGPKKNVHLMGGVQAEYADYVFADNISLRTVDGSVVPFMLDQPYRKSKLATYYVGIPLYLDFRLGRQVSLELNGYVNFLISAYTKYKKPVHREMMRGLNPVQAGCGVALYYSCVGLYARYSLVPLFRSNTAPEFHSATLGLALRF